ncbi:hypothetical protein CWC16_19680, partial [Pseudoalteromonas sp. S3776]
RTCICRARFLKGQGVRIVWSRFENEKGLTETRIFLSTNTDLAGGAACLLKKMADRAAIPAT